MGARGYRCRGLVNGSAGDGSNAITRDADGFVYIVAATSGTKSNNLFLTPVLKVDPKDGKILWPKRFAPSDAKMKFAKENSVGFGIDASVDNLLVTGTTGSNTAGGDAHVMLLAVKKSDGSKVANQSIELNKKVNDRGYVIKADGQGGALTAGNANSSALLMRVIDIDKEAAKID